MSVQELMAKERVSLPYEQAREVGNAAQSAGLGRILYVRDSETEYDSDEDPDDDLDI